MYGHVSQEGSRPLAMHHRAFIRGRVRKRHSLVPMSGMGCLVILRYGRDVDALQECRIAGVAL